MVFSRQKFNSFSLVKRSPILHQTTIFCINYGQWRKQSDNSTKVHQVEFVKNNERLVCGKQTADINNGPHNNNNHISYTLYDGSSKPVPNKTQIHTRCLNKAMKGNQEEKEKNLIQKRKSNRKIQVGLKIVKIKKSFLNHYKTSEQVVQRSC